MPRPIQGPPFPETPGTWLACYRYRWQPEGRPYSPEQLGNMLGVSGTTVRRWERDLLRPTWDDLQRFATTCELTPLEARFLFRAFHGRHAETAPDDRSFRDLVNQALNSDQPAFLMDSLFYIRAQNSYMGKLATNRTPAMRRPGEAPGNAIAGLFEPGRVARAPANIEESTNRWLRSFWYQTASATGSPAYRDLLRHLRGYGDFEPHWWELALTSTTASAPIDLPFVYEHPVRGRWRVYITRVSLPAIYYLREYLALDGAAEAFLAELRRDRANAVEINGPSHWSSRG